MFASTIGTPLNGGDVLLRHAYATLSLAAGDDIVTVSANLGHANIATTVNVYAHVLPRTKKSGATRLEAFVSGAAG